MRPLALLLLLAGCGSTGPSGTALPSGAYVVTANQGNTPVEFRFSVVEANADRVILDWTAGDVRGTLPVRDTAAINGDAYRVQWLGVNQGINRWLRFTSETCSGAMFTGPINNVVTTHWTGCVIAR